MMVAMMPIYCSCWLVSINATVTNYTYCERCGKPFAESAAFDSAVRDLKEKKPKRRVHGPMTHDRKRDWWNRYE